MPWLSDLARKRKCRLLLDPIPKDAVILEIGCGDGWVRSYLRQHGWKNYTGVDLNPPADLVGDICDYRSIGLKPEIFDVIIAFELVEHVDCFQQCWELLKPGGRLVATSPVPEFDWVMKALEAIGLNQMRTSPHDHLIHFDKVPYFPERKIWTVGALAQWGVFQKPAALRAMAATSSSS